LPEKALSQSFFYDLTAVTKMSEKALAAIINLSARTISNYNQQQKVLEPVSGDIC